MWLIGLCAALLAGAAWGGPPKKPAKSGNAKAAALAVVNQFEQAYKRKDKQIMLMKLMVPTTDALTLEKRYKWYRGYGPNDLPGSKQTLVLFESSHGSFVPSKYTVSSALPEEGGRWRVVVKEEGTYRDEDGRYKVNRIRHFKVTQFKGKWYIADYFLKENPEDYGFYCDDIVDKMTPLGK